MMKVFKTGSLNLLEPSGPVQGLLYLLQLPQSNENHKEKRGFLALIVKQHIESLYHYGILPAPNVFALTRLTL
jgi:hypothetical protein